MLHNSEKICVRKNSSCIISPKDLKSSHEDFEVIGVFNPAAIQYKDEIIILARIAEAPKEKRSDSFALPVWEQGKGYKIDWLPKEKDTLHDPRKIQDNDGIYRLKFVSHLRFFHSKNGEVIDSEGTALWPESPYEEYGIEDPRISYIDERYYITYVAVSRHGAATALASTKDFVTFERHGIIFCPENKDVVLFPEKFEGHYLALHRPNTFQRFCKPEMWIASSPDLLHWGNHHPLIRGKYQWEGDRIGAGTPPLKTDKGWLVMYHGSCPSKQEGEVGTYSAGILLLDLNNPRKILKRSEFPIMVPENDFEKNGYVPNVVFPTAIVPKGDTLLVYYGAADTSVGVTKFSLAELLR